MKKVLSILLSVVLVLSIMSPFTIFADEFTDTNINHAVVHDPSIYKDKNGKYYIVGSHMAMYDSDDMINWTQLPSSLDGSGYLGEDWKKTLEEPLKWTTAWQEWRKENDPNYKDAELEYNCWANDVIYNEHMGKYCLYGAVSVWGSTCSAIWLCTSDNIEGPYEYVHTFIYSGITKNTNPDNPRYNALPYTNSNIPKDLIETGITTRSEIIKQPWFVQDQTAWNYGHYDCWLGRYPNAIDPTPFIDKNGDMWLAYGSYSGGCFVIKLDNNTGLPDYQYMKNTDGYDMYFGMRISNTNEATEGTGEGPYIQYDPVSDYYYFYLTYGGLYYGGGYNIREYRSKNPDGPYEDASGNLATDMKNTGLKLVGNYKLSASKNGYLSGGHGSCLVDDDNSMYHAYHTRYLRYTDGEPFWDAFQTVIHKMVRTSNGWSVFLPFQYQGEENLTSVSKPEIVGVYEFVDTTDGIQNLSYNKNAYDTVYPTQSIVLNEDGTIGNIKHYDFVNTPVIVEDKTEITKEYLEKDVVGTWKLNGNGVDVSFKIGDVSYQGVFARQFDETNEKKSVLVFSAAGNNNTSIWGVKDENHSFELIKSQSANCTQKGYQIYKCSDCDLELTKNIKSALGHSYSATVVKPTCAKQGYTKYTCKRCKKTYNSNYVKATGKHTYDSGKITTKATYAKAGVKTYTCKVCSAKKTSSIAKLTLAKPTGVKISSLSKGFKLTWKKVSASKGYEIQYSTSSSFSNSKKITVTKNSILSKSVQKLKGNKKYYVRIRAYTTENGKKYYSSWVKTYVTTKK